MLRETLGVTFRSLVSAPLAFAITASAAEPVAAEAPAVLLDINSATVEQLAVLDYVTTDTAVAIVDLREKRGGEFESLEQLRAVPGVEVATLDVLRKSTEARIHLPVGTSKTYTTVDDVLAEFVNEPTVQQVQSWAQEYARLNPELVDGWMSASKSFALLPQFYVKGVMKEDWDQDWNYHPVDGSLDDPGDVLFDALDGAGKGADRQIEVRLTWDLDKLVMSSERIRVINEAQDIVKLRDKVLTEVTRLYFERRRVQVEMLLKPKSDLHGQVKEQLRLMELTANLDALTGGTFSTALMR